MFPGPGLWRRASTGSHPCSQLLLSLQGQHQNEMCISNSLIYAYCRLTHLLLFPHTYFFLCFVMINKNCSHRHPSNRSDQDGEHQGNLSYPFLVGDLYSSVLAGYSFPNARAVHTQCGCRTSLSLGSLCPSTCRLQNSNFHFPG